MFIKCEFYYIFYSLSWEKNVYSLLISWKISFLLAISTLYQHRHTHRYTKKYFLTCHFISCKNNSLVIEDQLFSRYLFFKFFYYFFFIRTFWRKFWDIFHLWLHFYLCVKMITQVNAKIIFFHTLFTHWQFYFDSLLKFTQLVSMLSDKLNF